MHGVKPRHISQYTGWTTGWMAEISGFDFRQEQQRFLFAANVQAGSG
jgi:hypothetical protein